MTPVSQNTSTIIPPQPQKPLVVTPIARVTVWEGSRSAGRVERNSGAMPRRGKRPGKPASGSRRKPFSGKAKKEQLKAKRERRRDEPFKPALAAADDVAGTVSGEGGVRVHSSLGRSGQENLLSTMFVKELDAVVAARKADAAAPINVSARGSRLRAEDETRSALPMPLPLHLLRASAGSEAPVPPPTSAKAFSTDAEKDAFQAWLKGIYGRIPATALNAFEVNMLVWRQLWHTLNKATVLALIVDARNPLFHLHWHLYHVVCEVLQKRLVVVLNKCDLVPPQALAQWLAYLPTAFPRVAAFVPFSAYAAYLKHGEGGETLAHRRRAIATSYNCHDALHTERRLPLAQGVLTALGLDAAWPAVKRRMETASGSGRAGQERRLAAAESSAAALAGLGRPLTPTSGDSDEDWSTTAGKGSRRRKVKGRSRRKASGPSPAPEPEPEPPQTGQEDQAPAVAEPVVVGMIGSPNVGKSSVINTLAGAKLVSVSRTPGHTKHAQTIPIMPNVTLLDCPGLVFPRTFDHSAEGVLSSIVQDMAAAASTPHTEPVEGGAEAPPEHGDIQESLTEEQGETGSKGAPHAFAAGAWDTDDDSSGEEVGGGDETAPPQPQQPAPCTPMSSLNRLTLLQEGIGKQVSMAECCGVVPLAQVREPFSAMRFLAETMDIEAWLRVTPAPEATWPADAPHTPHLRAQCTSWSPLDLCEAVAEDRGLFIARTGRPDSHAAGRAVLYDVVDGILPLWWWPPSPGDAAEVDPRPVAASAAEAEHV